MNIFILDEIPSKAAEYHCDKHLGRMIFEAAEALCTYAHSKQIKLPEGCYGRQTTLETNPSYQWLTESKDNMAWTMELIMGLERERLKRMSVRTHASTKVYFDTMIALDAAGGIAHEHTPFKLAMDEQFRDPKHPVESYRQFYKSKEARMKMVYKGRQVPSWMQK